MSLSGVLTASVELIPLGAFIRFVHFVPEHEVQFRTTETEEELFFFCFAVRLGNVLLPQACEVLWAPPNETPIVVLFVIFKGLNFPSRIISFW